MIGRSLALAVALVLATSVPAGAQDDEDDEYDEEEEYYYEKEASPYAEIHGLGGAIGGSGTGGFGALIGGHVTTWLAFEGEYDFLADSSTHIGTYSVKLTPMPDQKIQPYVRAGIGLMGGRDDHPYLFMGRFGLGMLLFLSESVALDAGGVVDVTSHDNNFYGGQVGLVYYFE